jgi:hypothetical protein
MAKAYEQRHPSRWEPGSDRHGQGVLAEVVPIRPAAVPAGFGLGHSFFRIAQVFASLRTQAAPAGSPPKPPTSPAPLNTVHDVQPIRPVSPDAA